jgi:hypothetical protein
MIGRREFITLLGGATDMESIVISHCREALTCSSPVVMLQFV